METTANVLGRIDIPVASYRPGVVSVTLDPKSIFYPTVCDPKPGEFMKFPEITPKLHQFELRMMSVRGVPVETFLVRVEELYEYEYQLDTQRIKLAFSYSIISDETSWDKLAVIEPVIAHIISYEDFIAVFFEGVAPGCSRLIDSKYRAFVHDGCRYRQYDITRVMKTVKVRPDGSIVEHHICTILFATTEQLEPSAEKKEEFLKIVSNACMIYYHIDLTDNPFYI